MFQEAKENIEKSRVAVNERKRVYAEKVLHDKNLNSFLAWPNMLLQHKESYYFSLLLCVMHKKRVISRIYLKFINQVYI